MLSHEFSNPLADDYLAAEHTLMVRGLPKNKTSEEINGILKTAFDEYFSRGVQVIAVHTPELLNTNGRLDG